MDRCNECDPSFGCFARPEQCSKSVLDLEGRVVGHRGRVLEMIRTIDAALSFSHPGDVSDPDKLLALSASLWRRMAQRHMETGEVKIVVVSEGGRNLITQVGGDDGRSTHDILDEEGGTYTIVQKVSDLG